MELEVCFRVGHHLEASDLLKVWDKGFWLVVKRSKGPLWGGFVEGYSERI